MVLSEVELSKLVSQSPFTPPHKYLQSIYRYTPLGCGFPKLSKALCLHSLNRFMSLFFLQITTHLVKEVCGLFLSEVFPSALHRDPGIPTSLVNAADMICYGQSLPEPFVKYPLWAKCCPEGVNVHETKPI